MDNESPSHRAVMDKMRAEIERWRDAVRDRESETLKSESELDEACAFLRRIIRYHDEDRAVTPGCTRLARVVGQVKAWLPDDDAPPSAPAQETTSGALRALVRLPPPVACACFQPPGSWCKTLGMPCGGTPAPAQDGAERCEECGCTVRMTCCGCGGTGKARR